MALCSFDLFFKHARVLQPDLLLLRTWSTPQTSDCENATGKPTDQESLNLGPWQLRLGQELREMIAAFRQQADRSAATAA